MGFVCTVTVTVACRAGAYLRAALKLRAFAEPLQQQVHAQALVGPASTAIYPQPPNCPAPLLRLSNDCSHLGFSWSQA